MPLDIGFRWRPAESADVLRNEFEVFALTGRRHIAETTGSTAAVRGQLDRQPSPDCLDDEPGAIFELKIELCVAGRFERP